MTYKRLSKFMMRASLLASAAFVIPGAFGAEAGTPAAARLQDPPALDALVAFDNVQSNLRTALVRYVADLDALMRRYPVRYSPVRAARLRDFYQGWHTQLAATHFERLNKEGQVDYILLRNRLRHDLALLALDERRAQELAPLVPFGDVIRSLEEQRLNRERVSPDEAAGALDGVAKTATALAAALEAEADKTTGLVGRKNISPTIALRAADQIEHLRWQLANWHTFYNDYDPIFTWWMKTTYPAADVALYDYAEAIRRHLVGIVPGETPPIIGDPVLAAGMQADLAAEMIPYTPEELVKIGEKEFARIVGHMKTVAGQMGYGSDWKAALEHVKTMAPPPGEIPWVLYDIARYSEDHIQSLDAVTVPPLAGEVWRFAMQTPENQLVNPFFTGGEVTHVSYPAGTMAYGAKRMSMRGNTPHFNFPTVQHELIPGHHLQDFMSSRFNGHRGLVGTTPFWLEGWALYWELVLWEEGTFARSNEDRMGMLFWQLHRAARIVFSLKYQLGSWSPEECIDFLVEEVGHERDNAAAEVRRTARDAPLYQISYMIGALQIRALRDEATANGMTVKDFNDALLTGGPMPIELVRARVLELPLAPDYESRWRFYGN